MSLIQKTFSSRKKAFTLIELAIVIIIIGILAAGISVGASLIRDAQLRTLLSDIRNIDNAVASFAARYSGPDNLYPYPGDFNQALNGSVAGDNDGVLEYVNDTSNAAEGLAVVHHIESLTETGLDSIVPAALTDAANLTGATAAVGEVTNGSGLSYESAFDGGTVIAFGNDGTNNAIYISPAFDTVAITTAATAPTAAAIADITGLSTDFGQSIASKLGNGSSSITATGTTSGTGAFITYPSPQLNRGGL